MLPWDKNQRKTGILTAAPKCTYSYECQLLFSFLIHQLNHTLVWEEGTEYVCQPSILSIYCNCLWVFNFEIFVLNLQMLVMFHYEVGGLFLNKL